MSQPGEHTIALNNYLQAQQKLNSLALEESSSGPPHSVTWTVTYRLDGEAIGTGSGPQKWQAKEAAAAEAMQKLGQA